MTVRCLSVLSLFTLVGAQLAAASSTTGNPTTGIISASTSPIYVDHVIAKPCGSGPVAIDVKDDVSSTNTVDLDLGEETWCYLYVELEWPSGGGLQTITVTGFTSYQTLNGEDDYVIELDPSSGTATLLAAKS